MCGIAGIFASRLSPSELRGALERMARSMAHRGPDQEAVQLFPEVAGGLAVRRLAMVDVAGGNQPIANEDGRVVALLNGEIYNHLALRRELVADGHRFRTRCDTEVLPHLYERFGDGALGRLRGMFGLAILDLRRRRLLIARDGPGIKPLYHAETPQGFVFASELRALFASGLVSPRPDLSALDVFMAVGFTPAPMTGFAGIEKLAGGARVAVDAGGVHREVFWSFSYRTDDPPLPDAEYVDELERSLEAAVDSHLRADVAIGAYLSGGWDSSLVTTMAARQLGSRMRTFSIVFPDAPDADEQRHSRRMAAWLGTDHQEIEFRSEALPDLLPRVVREIEEPNAATPVALSHTLASLAGASVKGVIGGEGADELFGGYGWFRRPYPYWLRHVTPRPLARLGARWAPEHRVRRWMRIAAAPEVRAADAEWVRFFLPDAKRRLLRPELRSDGPDVAPLLIPEALAATCGDHLQRRLAYDLRGRLADAILVKHDKVAMAHSLEVRVPFLDRDVIDLAARMPSHLKVHRGREKVVIGRLARRLLPPEIAARRKKGLSYPRGAWTRPPAADRFRQLLLDGVDRGPFLRAPLERFLSRQLGATGDERPMTGLVVLQLWWQEYFQSSPDAVPDLSSGSARV